MPTLTVFHLYRGFKANRKFRTFKDFEQIMEKNMYYFHWTLNEKEPFCLSKRETTPVIILESKSEMCKWSIIDIKIWKMAKNELPHKLGHMKFLN